MSDEAERAGAASVRGRVGEFTPDGHCAVCYRPWTYDAAARRFVCEPCERQRETARPRRFTSEQREQIYRLVRELERATYERAAELAGPKENDERYEAAVSRHDGAWRALDDYLYGREDG